MTRLTTPSRSRNVCRALALIALVGCAGAHASKAHTRTMKPAHHSTQSEPKPVQKPANPEPKPVVGELMA
jgi:glucose/arabinose dehydrogenase